MFICMCVYLHMCLGTIYMAGPCGYQKRVLDPLGLELPVVAMWVLGIEPGFSGKAVSVLNY